VAIDIEPNLIASLAAEQGRATRNLNPFLRDVVARVSAPDESADIVLLFNILHCERPTFSFRTPRTLRPGGRVGVLHWRSDVPTQGSSLDIRRLQIMAVWLREAGFDLVCPAADRAPYHFAWWAKTEGEAE